MELSIARCCLDISEKFATNLLYEFTECIDNSQNVSYNTDHSKNDSRMEFSLLDMKSLYSSLDEELNSSSMQELHDAQLSVLEQLCLADNLHARLDSIFRVINTSLGLLSILFLLLTLLVYIILPELHNLHGYLVSSNILVNILQTGYLVTVYNLSYQLNHLSCKTLGYLGYFLTMAMFTWMTVLSLDLAWTINRSRIPRAGSSNQRLVGYSCLSWGLSVGLTAVLALIDLNVMNIRERLDLYHPNVGLNACFVDQEVHGLYLHGPVVGLLLLNSASYLGTFISLRRTRQKTFLARQSSRCNSVEIDKNINLGQDLTTEMVLCVRLFIVMGISWIFEIIHFLIPNNPKESGGMEDTHQLVLEIIMKVIGTLNLSRGIFLFFIFLCKRRIIVRVREVLLPGRTEGLPRRRERAILRHDTALLRLDSVDLASSSSTQIRVNIEN